jgi:RNA polymerase sigma factor (sigma-70 family)
MQHSPIMLGHAGTSRPYGSEEADVRPADDAQLVAEARQGNPDAFGELVRRNRARALGVAYKLTQDHHLAEDVVQEALVRAFLRLGTLVDSRSFSPWLRRIVRNEAYMRLRRGGLYRLERPFASWESGAAGEGTVTSSDVQDPTSGWRDIDVVLFRLGSSAHHAAQSELDPSGAVLRKELIEGIRNLLHCLSAREKRIFEAYFFDQLPPQEIAALLDTSVANVYNSISRSRGKVQQARIRKQISLYIEQRATLNKPRRILLAPPALIILWKE